MSHRYVEPAQELGDWMNSTAFTDGSIMNSKQPGKKLNVVTKNTNVISKKRGMHTENMNVKSGRPMFVVLPQIMWASLWIPSCLRLYQLYPTTFPKPRFELYFITWVFINLSWNSEQHQPADHGPCAPTGCDAGNPAVTAAAKGRAVMKLLLNPWRQPIPCTYWWGRRTTPLWMFICSVAGSLSAVPARTGEFSMCCPLPTWGTIFS